MFHRNNLVLGRFNKLKRNEKLHNDERVLKFFKLYKRPSPPLLIAEATGISNSKLSQVLKSLVKHRILKVAYKRRVPFYYFNDGYRR
jgi:DNA invertase Pin-like site-specific DNA recombinase